MERGLRDEAIGEGQTQDASDASREAEEEKVPVETGGFSERKLAALSNERRDWIVSKKT